MSLTLTYDGTTLFLNPGMQWTDEYDWSPVVQSLEHSTTGALLVDVAVKQAGRQITLDGAADGDWIPRSMCETLNAWAALPGITLTLRLRGIDRTVMFDQGRKGFEARPVKVYADMHFDSGDWYAPILRFVEI